MQNIITVCRTHIWPFEITEKCTLPLIFIIQCQSFHRTNCGAFQSVRFFINFFFRKAVWCQIKHIFQFLSLNCSQILIFTQQLHKPRARLGDTVNLYEMSPPSSKRHQYRSTSLQLAFQFFNFKMPYFTTMRYIVIVMIL